jgi:transcriptional regulator with XRE-family HTH domain
MVAEVLTERFAESGRTQAQVGADAGVSQSQLSKYLRGTRVPHLDVLDAICRALGVDVGALVADASSRRRKR